MKENFLGKYLSLFRIGKISTHKPFPFSVEDLSEVDKNNEPKNKEKQMTITLGDEFIYYVYLTTLHPWLYPLIYFSNLSKDQSDSIKWLFGEKSRELFLSRNNPK